MPESENATVFHCLVPLTDKALVFDLVANRIFDGSCVCTPALLQPAFVRLAAARTHFRLCRSLEPGSVCANAATFGSCAFTCFPVHASWPLTEQICAGDGARLRKLNIPVGRSA